MDAPIQQLRNDLLQRQLAIAEAADFPVVLVTTGMAGAGKGETLNLLNKWLENRVMATHALDAPTDEERERPRMWRFWRALPPKGRFGIFVNGWYGDAVFDYAAGRLTEAGLDDRLREIAAFERMVAAEGALLLKFWYHISKNDQYRLFRKLEADPQQHWRVSELDWVRHTQYDAIDHAGQRAREITDAEWAPWHVIDDLDAERQSVGTARILCKVMERRLKGRSKEVRAAGRAPKLSKAKARQTLADVDLTARLKKKEYVERLAAAQARLALLARAPEFRRHAVVCVFEGHDAAGKGGVIHRLTEGLDPRLYRVIRVAAPTDEERAQPWLWRFWRHLPRRGRFTLFDRSWYGRVLVERVEGFAAKNEWQRAYDEINEFEAQLLRSRVIVAKFWLTIDAEEQLKRFNERAETPHKQHKLTDEDWRNREKWDTYNAAINDMVRHTGTTGAPWDLIPANDKRYARVRTIETLCTRIETTLRGA